MADVAVLGFDIDSTPARSAATDLAKLQQAATNLAREMSKTDRALRRSNGQFASSAEVVERYGNEVQELARKYNPALSAVYQFQQAEAELNRALMLGVVTQDQYDASLERVRTQLAANATAAHGAAGAMDSLAHQQRQTAGAAGNVFAQFNDIGVMMASGQSPFVLALQQGTQLNQVWGQMGNNAKSIGTAIRGAFASMLNPVSLLTIGVIAGGAALFQWATAADEAKEGSDDFLSSLEGLEAAVGRIGSAPSLMTPEGVAKVRAEYGMLTTEVRTLITALGEVEQQQARMAAQATITEILGSFEAGFFTSRMQAVIDITGLATEEARQFEIQLNQLAVADGPQNQLEIVTQLRRRIQESGDAQGKFYQSLVRTEAQLRRLVKEADELAGRLRDSARFMELFSQTASAASMQHLVNQAGALVANLRAAASVRLPGAGDFGENLLGAATNAWNMALDRVEEVERGGLGDRPGRRPFELGVPDPSDTGSGGGGGGGASAVDKIAQDFQNRWEALQEGFRSEFDLSLTEYQKQLETLDWALNQKLIKEQEFQRNKQLLYTMTFGTEAEQNLLQYQLDQQALQTALDQKFITHQTYLERLKALQFEYQSQAHLTDQNMLAADLGRTSDYFGQLVSLTGSGYDTLEKLQKSFAASQALVNAYLAASQTLADPTLGFWAKMAAYGKVLAAGLGLVSAIKGSGGGGSSSGAGSASNAGAQQAAQAPPPQRVLVNFEGDDWLVDMASSMIDQIYEQSKDGRVIISRDF